MPPFLTSYRLAGTHHHRFHPLLLVTAMVQTLPPPSLTSIVNLVHRPGHDDLPRIFARVYRHPPSVQPSRFAASRARISTAMGVIFDERKYPVVDSAPTVRSTGTNPPEAPWTRNGSTRKPSSCTARSLKRRTNACHGVADDSRCTSKTAC